MFSHLPALVPEGPLYSDCALVFDAMAIQSLVYYNKAIDAIEEFVSYGKDIGAFHEEAVAEEALVFMLVGFRRSWKYPVGYLLTCIQNKCKPRTVTCDGTSTNFNAMQSLGCKLGTSVSSISGSFFVEDYASNIFHALVLHHVR